MTLNGKTRKDQKNQEPWKGAKLPKRKEKGGHHNLIKEAEEERQWGQEREEEVNE